MLVLLLIGCLAQAEEAVIDENVTTTTETVEEESVPAPANPTTTTTVTVIEDSNASVEVTVDQNGETQINVSVTPEQTTQDESMKNWDDTMEMLELIKKAEAEETVESDNESE